LKANKDEGFDYVVCFLSLLFFLDKKSNKKVKANPNGSARFAGQRTRESVIVMFFIVGKGIV